MQNLAYYIAVLTCSRSGCHNFFVPCRKDVTYCSARCGRAIRRHRNPRYQADQRARARMRDALQRGAGVARLITQQQVWDKSNGICFYCMLPMIWYKDIGSKYYPDAFSMEHVIPVVHEGNHTIDNLEGAHRHCNDSKNSRSVTDLSPEWRERCRQVIQSFQGL